MRILISIGIGTCIGIVISIVAAGAFTGGTPLFCRIFFACTHDQVTSMLGAFLFFLMVIAFIGAFALAAIYNAKAKAPPITGADIQRIIEDAKQRVRNG